MTWMDRMHRIFSGDGGLAVLDIHKPEHDQRRSPPHVQQPAMLIILCILCILCIDVQESISFCDFFAFCGEPESLTKSHLMLIHVDPAGMLSDL